MFISPKATQQVEDARPLEIRRSPIGYASYVKRVVLLSNNWLDG